MRLAVFYLKAGLLVPGGVNRSLFPFTKGGEERSIKGRSYQPVPLLSRLQKEPLRFLAQCMGPADGIDEDIAAYKDHGRYVLWKTSSNLFVKLTRNRLKFDNFIYILYKIINNI